MPEYPEEDIFKDWIADFIEYAKNNLPAGALKVKAIYTDLKGNDLQYVRGREQRLLLFATTLSLEMLKQGVHRGWAVRLERLAAAIPDTHGLLIREVKPVLIVWIHR